jgi:predicted phage terminase large subunit-like protein
MTKYIPITLTPKQAIYLNHPSEEGLYGGAAGGGKSDGILAGALQYADIPGYNALILRRNTRLLEQGGALIPRSKAWLQDTDARWNDQKKTWVFPSGATLTFGYLENRDDATNYKGTAWQYISVDELTEIPWEEAYDYLHSRLRKPSDEDDPLHWVPLRMRCTTNPGGPGHEWVKRKFVTEKRPGHVFIPAFLKDNPYLDQVDYEARLNKLHPIIRDQLLHGIWDAVIEGNVFKTEWWKIVPWYTLPKSMRMVRYWDLAATEGKGDFVVGLKMGEADNHYHILDLVRGRLSPEAVEDLIMQTAKKDGIGVRQVIELEPGASSKILANHFRKDVLKGLAYYEDRPPGSKLARSYPAATMVAAGLLDMVEAAWNQVVITESAMFPSKDPKAHDDIVDTISGGYNFLANAGGRSQPDINQATGGSRMDDYTRSDAMPYYSSGGIF